MKYKGKVKDGVIVLEGNCPFPEGAAVEVDWPETMGDGFDEEDSPTLFERLRGVVGQAQGLAPDASRSIDRDLYGSEPS